MKKMIIFEPAMCCSTGVCGPSVDPELLRVSMVVQQLKTQGIEIERHNLASNPQAFMDYAVIHETLRNEGMTVLPITLVDGLIFKKGTYPTNEEFCQLNGISFTDVKQKCGCKDGCC